MCAVGQRSPLKTLLRLCKQDQVDAAVKQLLALKAQYKELTGREYKPGAAPAQKAAVPAQSSCAPAAADLHQKVAAQGDLVRKLKAEKAPKVSPPQAASTRFGMQEPIVAPCLGTSGRSGQDFTGSEEALQGR